MCDTDIDLQLAADDENGDFIRFTRDVIRSYVVYRLKGISEIAECTFYKDNQDYLWKMFCKGQRVPEDKQIAYYDRMNNIRATTMNEGTIRNIGQTGRKCCGKSSIDVQRELDTTFTRTFCNKAIPEICWTHIVYFVETLVSIMNADHNHYSYGADQLAVNFAHKSFNNRGDTLNDWLAAVGGWDGLLTSQHPLESSASEESIQQSTVSTQIYPKINRSTSAPRARSLSPTKRRPLPATIKCYKTTAGRRRHSGGDPMAFSVTTSRRLSHVSDDKFSFGTATASERGTSMGR